MRRLVTFEDLRIGMWIHQGDYYFVVVDIGENAAYLDLASGMSDLFYELRRNDANFRKRYEVLWSDIPEKSR